jgi:hypothetical protein
MTETSEAPDRRRKHVKRRMATAEAGRHLPTLNELLQKSPFMGGNARASTH